MRCVLIAATSLDGFIASKDHPYPPEWTSAEDKALLQNIVSQFPLLVMGKTTFESYGKQHAPGKLRVILTTDSATLGMEEIPGELEFCNATPQEFIAHYSKYYNSCLLLGGAYVYDEFLKSNVVDEIFLSIEPVEFKSGLALTANNQPIGQFLANYEPVTTKLNDSGTLLKHYKLHNPH